MQRQRCQWSVIGLPCKPANPCRLAPVQLAWPRIVCKFVGIPAADPSRLSGAATAPVAGGDIAKTGRSKVPKPANGCRGG
ncbi:hypothetical protein GCM10027084_05030 [Pseudoxanthomonas sangjuensis]